MRSGRAHRKGKKQEMPKPGWYSQSIIVSLSKLLTLENVTEIPKG